MERLLLESVGWRYWYESFEESGTKFSREFGPDFDVPKDEEVDVAIGTGKNFRPSTLYFSEDYEHPINRD